jgi:hypothetical protein
MVGMQATLHSSCIHTSKRCEIVKNLFYFKVFNNLTPFTPDLVFTTYTPPPCLRSNSPIIQKPIHASNKFLSTTFYRSIDAWNYLSVELRQAQSLNAFKSGIKSVDLVSFLKGSSIV